MSEGVKETRFAVIGCGAVSRVHIEQIKKIPGARLIAVSDIAEAVAKRVGEAEDVPWYTDFRDILMRDDVDVVNIVTPSGTHSDIITLAAQAGKHVLVEKPIDITVERAERAIRACRVANVKLGVVSQHRFDDATMIVKRNLASGVLGEPFLVQASVDWYRAQSYYDRAPGAGTWAMDGGGVLMIQALHTIDVVQHLLGPIKSVFAKTSTATHDGIEVEDTAVATLTFVNGSVGALSATTSAYPGLSTRIDIFGRLGTAIIENDTLTHLFVVNDADRVGMNGGHVENTADKEIGNKEPGIAHRRQIRDMMAAIYEDRDPLVSGEESLNVVKVILAMYQSARTNLPVNL